MSFLGARRHNHTSHDDGDGNENDIVQARDDPTYPSSSTATSPPVAKRGRDDTRGNPSTGIARHTLGIALLLIVVVLWTASNFLASTILADDTYSKPFFVTYFNTSFFTVSLVPTILRRVYSHWKAGKLSKLKSVRSFIAQIDSGATSEETRPFFASDDEYGDEYDDERGGLRDESVGRRKKGEEDAQAKLSLRETARLSLEFCLLWFMANYFALACLQHTTVASTTILTSTSGVWTLIFGAFIGVEKFTLRKLLGVFASLAGIFLISRVDMSGSSDENRGSFPHKSPGEIVLGDFMAALSAILYGVYTIVMKKRVGDESRVNMPLFFGLVGLINFLLLWPGFVILHFSGFETFGLPETSRVWMIILVNSSISLASDICWAYSLLLTTPLVVTVGLSLTIPLSLIGQIFLHGQYSSATYWFGATVVFLSFAIVNYESKSE